MKDPIEELLEYLLIQQKANKKDSKPYYRTSKGRVYKKSQLKQDIRAIIGMDKQCSVCSHWKFDFDLTQVEGTALLVCSNCAEKLLSGEIVLSDQ